MEESIFQPYLGTRGIFKMDREILRPSYIPGRLPHRESHIDQLAQILVNALRGERPSNVLIFGKTGTGKTAVVKYIENEFRKADGARMVDHPRAVRLAELVLDVLDHGRLPGAGLAEDEHVARPLAPQRVHEDLRELVDVALPVREPARAVRRPQDLAVHFEDATGPQVWLEDAFFHMIPAPPKSEKVLSPARVLSEEIAGERAGIRGSPQKGLRPDGATLSPRRDPIFIRIRL